MLLLLNWKEGLFRKLLVLGDSSIIFHIMWQLHCHCVGVVCGLVLEIES